MSKKNSLFRVLACFVLFPFLYVAAPEYYDECEDLDPDVCLDLFAIPQETAASATIHAPRGSTGIGRVLRLVLIIRMFMRLFYPDNLQIGCQSDSIIIYRSQRRQMNLHRVICPE
jgi:hypothetical protein